MLCMINLRFDRLHVGDQGIAKFAALDFFATEKQILCIQGLARKNGVPVPELLKQAGVRVFNDMSVRQASQMIEGLKGSSAN